MQRCCAIAVVGLLGGCSSPGPTPAEYAERQLPGATAAQPGAAEPARRALQDLRAGRLAAARNRAEMLVAEQPRAARARAVFGRCLVEVARERTPPDLAVMERAEGELLLARRLLPGDPLVELLYAEFLEADGQVSLAAEVLERVLAEHPEYADGLRAAARLRYELGEERRALPLLNRWLALRPDDAEALYRLAQCQVRLAEAVARGDTATAEPPAAGAARDGYLRAADTFRRYRTLRPGDVDGYLGEAHARFQAIRVLPGPPGAPALPKTAAEVTGLLGLLGQASAAAPAAPGPLHTRGVVLEYLQSAAEARSAYEAALAKDSRFLPSILNLARLLDASGDRQTARVYCQRALELEVSSAERDRLLKYLAATAR